jgi:arsenate reductase (glutaredoxin)
MEARLKLYGIKSCDTCRRALKELEGSGREVEFVDVRTQGLSDGRLAAFKNVFGDRLVNRSSTTWRGLDAAERERDTVSLIAAHPTLMKRPVIEDGDDLWLGWAPDVRARFLG